MNLQLNALLLIHDAESNIANFISAKPSVGGKYLTSKLKLRVCFYANNGHLIISSSSLGGALNVLLPPAIMRIRNKGQLVFANYK